jgi:glutamate-1-semialdehyde 2,1-aminomutase
MEGQFIWDVDGRRYIDLHAAYGTAALGHNDPHVRSAVIEALETEGVLFGTAHPREVELSELLVSEIPCAEMVALCGGGGSDPLYFGYRLARSLTGRKRLLKFEGGYHGWHDELAVSVRPRLEDAGPADAPQAVPLSAGFAQKEGHAIIGVLNDPNILERIFEQYGRELAAAVIEPVCHAGGCIPIDRGFLQLLRDLCTRHGVILMFDEVMTGFRHSVQGAQTLLGVTPDLAAFGKAMGNGYQVSALVGRREVMSGLSPLGPAFYSGTFCGHLTGVVASLATIRAMKERQIHAHTQKLGDHVREELNRAAAEHDIRAICQSFGSIYCLYLGTDRPIRNYRDIAMDAHSKDSALNRQYRLALLEGGIYMHPYYSNRSFLSAAHTMEEVSRIVDVTIDFMRRNRDAINSRVSVPSGAARA